MYSCWNLSNAAPLFPQKKYAIEVKSFAREELHEAGVFVKEYIPHILVPKGGVPPKLYATGVGANQFAERINKSLNVR